MTGGWRAAVCLTKMDVRGPPPAERAPLMPRMAGVWRGGEGEGGGGRRKADLW